MSRALRICARAQRQPPFARSARLYSEAKAGPSKSEPAAPSQGSRTPEERSATATMMTNWKLAILGSIALGIGYELGSRNARRTPKEDAQPTGTPAPSPPPAQAKGASAPAASTLPLSAYPPPQHDVSAANIAAARAEFVALLGPAGVDDHEGNRRNHSSTEWSPSPTSRAPDLIVLPRSTADVSAIMRVCHRRRLPVTAFAGGTSLDGALAATRAGVSLDFHLMNSILAVHERDLDAVVQPGVGHAELNARLEPLGLFFPVDPAPTAQIGGMVATGCSGTNAYRYGPMKDWTLGLTVVLADGTVIKTRGRPRKSTAGYDLTRLMVGSSGTLGIVTEAALKVTALPANLHAAVVPFPSLKSAVNTVIGVVQRGLQLEAIELLDETFMRCINGSGYTARAWQETPTLFIKFAGPSRAAVQDQLATVRELAAREGSLAFEADGEPEAVAALWAARKDALPSYLATKKDPSEVFASSDVAVPISRMAELVQLMGERAQAQGFAGGTIGHVGDGNFHFGVLYAPGDEEVKALGLMRESQELAVQMEGTVTGEHGVGLALRDALRLELGDDAIDAMRRIKDALDPLCLLNCDKIVRMEEGPEH